MSSRASTIPQRLSLAALAALAASSASLAWASPAPHPAIEGDLASLPAEAALPPIEPVEAATLGVPTPIEDPSGVALRHFYRALAATARGEDKTRIVVFGASHVAGDVFTGVFRHQLMARYGDAGLGFVVPAKPWRDYYNKDANIDYSKGWDSYWVSRSHSRDDGLYGLAGVTFSSDSRRDYARVSTAKKNPFGRSVSRVEVYYWKQRRGGDFYLLVDGKRRRRVRTRAKDPGPGYAALSLPDGPHEIELRPRGNGLVTLFGVALDRDVPGVVMDHLGINGARAATQLEWDPRVFADQLARRDPDLLVLAYGTNAIGDTDEPIERYERRLDLVVNRLRSLLPNASCLYIGPSDRPVKLSEEGPDGEPLLSFVRRPRQQAVIDVQRRVALRYGCGYWDWAHAMGGDLSMVSWVHSEPRYGARDYIHHTRAGYQRIAELFMDALMGPLRATDAPRFRPPGRGPSLRGAP